jgi:predicted transcriptional regulator
MKIAISLPDDVFRDLEACARRLRTSRSALLARGARELLSRIGKQEDATRAWNAVIARAGQPGHDPAAAAVRRRSLGALRRGARF